MSRDSARPALAQAEMGFEVLEKVICFQGFFRMERYRLRHRKFDGGWSRPITRELLERGHAAAVLPYDPERDRVVLIEQFRAGAMSAPGGPWLLEIVAGMIDTDEPAEQVVTRESVEEAGCCVSDLIPLYDYLVSPGGTTERIALFCGRVDTSGIGGIHGKAEEDEDIKVHVMALAQARALLNSGRIGSASAIIALQWLLLNQEIVRQRWLSG
ncbi:NUDIX domain-containing protein [Nitrosomonas sp. ANs5]|uniref:NUDIX domain-containing protein n=1 Tax=Nitrosomonas sp. ANs5 TaxID=3423941 RepID=UPI003D33857D